MAGGDWKQLFKGIQANDYELVKYYLRVGIDPNYQHPEYMALPLAESLRYGHFEITELLLQHGADASIIELESQSTPAALAESMADKRYDALIRRYGNTE